MTARPLVPATRVVRRFSPRENLATACRGYSLYRNIKGRVISTEVQYRAHLKHSVICLLVTARAYVVRRIALLFLSRWS